MPARTWRKKNKARAIGPMLENCNARLSLIKRTSMPTNYINRTEQSVRLTSKSRATGAKKVVTDGEKIPPAEEHAQPQTSARRER
eukprot:5111584-Pleurochrysis_carterae.AAC.2